MRSAVRPSRGSPGSAAKELNPIEDTEGENFHGHRLDEPADRIHVAMPFFVAMSDHPEL